MGDSSVGRTIDFGSIGRGFKSCFPSQYPERMAVMLKRAQEDKDRMEHWLQSLKNIHKEASDMKIKWTERGEEFDEDDFPCLNAGIEEATDSILHLKNPEEYDN